MNNAADGDVSSVAEIYSFSSSVRWWPHVNHWCWPRPRHCRIQNSGQTSTCYIQMHVAIMLQASCLSVCLSICNVGGLWSHSATKWHIRAWRAVS